MEIDHFNPQPGKGRNNYGNLFLATRHCNGSKSNTWPSRKLRKSGIRFLNPCEEADYGHHIFEHPVTHRLVGVTPAGKYHIISCDLNAEHLTNERRERAEIWDHLDNLPVTVKTDPDAFPLESSRLLRVQAEKMIPLIPYLSKGCPEYSEELQLMQALRGVRI